MSALSVGKSLHETFRLHGEYYCHHRARTSSAWYDVLSSRLHRLSFYCVGFLLFAVNSHPSQVNWKLCIYILCVHTDEYSKLPGVISRNACWNGGIIEAYGRSSYTELSWFSLGKMSLSFFSEQKCTLCSFYIWITITKTHACFLVSEFFHSPIVWLDSTTVHYLCHGMFLVKSKSLPSQWNLFVKGLL